MLPQGSLQTHKTCNPRLDFPYMANLKAQLQKLTFSDSIVQHWVLYLWHLTPPQRKGNLHKSGCFFGGKSFCCLQENSEGSNCEVTIQCHNQGARVVWFFTKCRVLDILLPELYAYLHSYIPFEIFSCQNFMSYFLSLLHATMYCLAKTFFP